jgi:hypothetical protein
MPQVVPGSCPNIRCGQVRTSNRIDRLHGNHLLGPGAPHEVDALLGFIVTVWRRTRVPEGDEGHVDVGVAAADLVDVLTAGCE